MLTLKTRHAFNREGNVSSSLISGLACVLSTQFRAARGPCKSMKGVVSKETVVLRWWGSSIQKFGFINGVDNVNWPPYRDSKS